MQCFVVLISMSYINHFLSICNKVKDILLSLLLTDTMDNWDQQKLEEVVEKKHGEKEKKNTTEIVCSLSLISLICWGGGRGGAVDCVFGQDSGVYFSD